VRTGDIEAHDNLCFAWDPAKVNSADKGIILLAVPSQIYNGSNLLQIRIISKVPTPVVQVLYRKMQSLYSKLTSYLNGFKPLASHLAWCPFLHSKPSTLNPQRTPYTLNHQPHVMVGGSQAILREYIPQMTSHLPCDVGAFEANVQVYRSKTNPCHSSTDLKVMMKKKKCRPTQLKATLGAPPILCPCFASWTRYLHL